MHYNYVLQNAECQQKINKTPNKIFEKAIYKSSTFNKKVTNFRL